MGRAKKQEQHSFDAADAARLGVIDRPQSPQASAERLRRLAGVIKLTKPVPPADLFEDDCGEPLSDDARH